LNNSLRHVSTLMPSGIIIISIVTAVHGQAGGSILRDCGGCHMEDCGRTSLALYRAYNARRDLRGGCQRMAAFVRHLGVNHRPVVDRAAGVRSARTLRT
jgi:hypothetical protein